MSDEIVPPNAATDSASHTVDSLISAFENSAAAVDGSSDSLTRLLDNRPKLNRALDLIIAVILLLIVLPVGSLIGLVITLSGQPPFCSQIRIGKGGCRFSCLKFRTMRSDSDVAVANAKLVWETRRELRRDPRVTRLGHALRATGLDELPQLINVLIGDMSFTGPRPVTHDELAKYYNSAKATAYLSARPGLTGWRTGRHEPQSSDPPVLGDSTAGLV